MTPGQQMQQQFEFEGSLRRHGLTVFFHSLDDVSVRWEKLRSAINDFRLGDREMTKRGGKPAGETYAQAFHRVTGEPLTQAVAA